MPNLPPLNDLLGYAASALVLITFSARSIVTLRLVAIASNLMFIAYAFAASLPPVLALHLLLLPLNAWRLWQSADSMPSDPGQTPRPADEVRRAV